MGIKAITWACDDLHKLHNLLEISTAMAVFNKLFATLSLVGLGKSSSVRLERSRTEWDVVAAQSGSQFCDSESGICFQGYTVCIPYTSAVDVLITH